MEQEKSYSIIVTYTFHNDNKRNSFISMLRDIYEDVDELDESTYGYNESNWAESKTKIKEICDKIKPNSDESVAMFASGCFTNCNAKKDRIIMSQIAGKSIELLNLSEK